jgi:glutaminyl-tRNA synthetase
MSSKDKTHTSSMASHPETDTKSGSKDLSKPSHFLRQIIEHDIQNGTYKTRRWAGSPGGKAHQEAADLDHAKIRTRFPPEPNGYLHIGHAKSICINFGLAKDFEGACHMRFDDTNPEKEDTEYVDSILDVVRWLGFDWVQSHGDSTESNLYHASDYFDFMHQSAVALIEHGDAYVDEQSAQEMKDNRGDFSRPGVNSPFRNRSVEENLSRFQDMKNGTLEEGSAVLRAKIDMASPNLNMRDPAIYRIRKAHHHRTADKWCIYPMYTFAHPIEDALEQITHSICTLEFEDQRPFYDWLLDKLISFGLLSSPPPRQYEFSRLNLTYVITSKRKLAQLVNEKRVNGWDDPRMPTLVGLRRRGYTPSSLRSFIDRVGVTKSESWIDYSTLEGCIREDLEGQAPRAMAVLDPLKLVLTNWQDVMGQDESVSVKAPVHPSHPDLGDREFLFSKNLWIERSDFEEKPPAGFFRLFPGNKVRLKYGYVVECTGFVSDTQGKVEEVHCKIIADTRSGTPGANSVKVKGVITWVSELDAMSAELRLYDRLFMDSSPDSGGKDFLSALNPESLKVVHAKLEPSLKKALPGERFQFERIGYFIADAVDHQAQQPVFNRITGLKDSWGSRGE